MNPKIDRSKLSASQLAELENWERGEKQLQTLQDIADMSQELVNLMDDLKKNQDVKKVGTILLDMKKVAEALRDKKDPEQLDYSRPIVKAVTDLDKAFAKHLKALDLKPNIKVDAPKVEAPDLSGIEDAIAQMPQAFEKAIKLIPKPVIPKTDNKPLLEAWERISDQLESLENVTRMKTQAPTTMKVTNPDGSSIGSLTDSTYSASAVDAASSGDNTIVAITNGARLYYVALSANGANSADVTAIVKIGSSEKFKVSLKAGSIFARNIGAGRRYLTGSVGDDIIVNLSTAQTVHVSVEYEDI